MIGVLCNRDQRGVVEEFFELFKTPWEFYRPERAYDVVLTTTEWIDGVNAKLLVVFGVEAKRGDAAHQLHITACRHNIFVTHAERQIPIYGALVAFGPTGAAPLVTGPDGTVAVRLETSQGTTIRVGYDIFQEVKFLLGTGQPVGNAAIPTLDFHIDMLRQWMLDAAIHLIEIPPTPAGYGFTVCLSHDIDFVGIRQHKFDHTMLGFLYRATVGAVRDLLRRKISLARASRMWGAALSLPFVHLGWVRDFWAPFDWYVQVEKGLQATYFLIPFKRQAGDNVPSQHPSHRAAPYDIGDLPEWTQTLLNEGCEIGVHGIDAWHSAEAGRRELARVAHFTGRSQVGMRVHWLFNSSRTMALLDEAGFDYDSTAGYNETIGYKNGTSQVFRPLETVRLLELPMHIQDGALFLHNRLNLSDDEAWKRCASLTDHLHTRGGVLTLLWHDRSHGPERFWGEFYVRLVTALKASNAWFASASQAVDWFRTRRDVRFEVGPVADCPAITRASGGGEIVPPLCIRFHHPRGATAMSSPRDPSYVDVAWNGRSVLDIAALRRAALGLSAALSPSEYSLP